MFFAISSCSFQSLFTSSMLVIPSYMQSSVKRFTGLSLKDLRIFSSLWFECFASHLFYLALWLHLQTPFSVSIATRFFSCNCLSTFIHWWYHYYWQWFYLHHLSFLTAQFVFWTQEPWFSSLLPWTVGRNKFIILLSCYFLINSICHWFG